MSKENILEKWVSAIDSGDPKQVLTLYDEKAHLLPTFSPEEKVGHQAILHYFEGLLSTPVQVVVVTDTLQRFEEVHVHAGLYTFIKEGQEILARFTFCFS